MHQTIVFIKNTTQKPKTEALNTFKNVSKSSQKWLTISSKNSSCPKNTSTKQSLVSFGEKPNKNPSFPVKFSCRTSCTCTKHEIPPVYGAKIHDICLLFHPLTPKKCKTFYSTRSPFYAKFPCNKSGSETFVSSLS
jgi:hypothetical protein